MTQIHGVIVNPHVCGGRLTVRGMRTRVKDVLDLFATGVDQAEILGDYPYLGADDIRVLAFAARQGTIPSCAARREFS